MIVNDRAERFRRLHQPDAGSILVLPNVWDAMSARIVEEAGARALATTSAGVSWSLGRRDGERLTREEMIGVVRRIVSAVQVPVTADVEGGYGSGSPGDVAETVRAVIAAGAAGINLEDTSSRDSQSLIRSSAQAERLEAARQAAEAEGVPLFINARTDAYLFGIGDPATRFDDTVRRARIYKEAGADGIFVPGVTDVATIERLVQAIEAPLNILASPGAPSTSELRQLGVARVSVGGALTRSAMAHIRTVAEELLRDGTYESLRGGIAFGDADGLFAPVKQ